MPVKLGQRAAIKSAEPRIEIIPLIDIMFFLLAAFMLVSLSMVNLKSIKVTLPVAGSASADSKHDLVDVSVSAAGLVYVDKQRLSDRKVIAVLTADRDANPQVRILLSGDRDAHQSDIIHALDLVRSAGIDKVAFKITPRPESSIP